LATAAIDLGKGVIAALLLPPLGSVLGLDTDALVLGLACVLAAAVGHCYPIWFNFRGGKGAGTLFGGMLCLLPLITGGAFLVWLGVLFLTGYVGLATVCAGIALPLIYVWVGGSGAALALCVAAAVLIVYMHRSNLQRLMTGTEHCFSKIRLLPGPKPH
jgi:glycerol-3-phosphate acyltransferase PlsY